MWTSRLSAVTDVNDPRYISIHILYEGIDASHNDGVASNGVPRVPPWPPPDEATRPTTDAPLAPSSSPTIETIHSPSPCTSARAFLDDGSDIPAIIFQSYLSRLPESSFKFTPLHSPVGVLGITGDVVTVLQTVTLPVVIIYSYNDIEYVHYQHLPFHVLPVSAPLSDDGSPTVDVVFGRPLISARGAPTAPAFIYQSRARGLPVSTRIAWQIVRQPSECDIREHGTPIDGAHLTSEIADTTVCDANAIPALIAISQCAGEGPAQADAASLGEIIGAASSTVPSLPAPRSALVPPGIPLLPASPRVSPPPSRAISPAPSPTTSPSSSPSRPSAPPVAARVVNPLVAARAGDVTDESAMAALRTLHAALPPLPAHGVPPPPPADERQRTSVVVDPLPDPSDSAGVRAYVQSRFTASSIGSLSRRGGALALLVSVLVASASVFGPWPTEPVPGAYTASIELKPDAVPFFSPHRPSPYHTATETGIELQAQINDGIIAHVPSGTILDWCSPGFAVAKRGTTAVRIVVDYTRLNPYIIPPIVSFPDVWQCIYSTSSANLFTAIDLVRSFHGVLLDPASQLLTAFHIQAVDSLDSGKDPPPRMVWHRLYYTSMPMGLSSSAQHLHLALRRALGEYVDAGWLVIFVDDILIMTHETDMARPYRHIFYIYLVLSALARAGFRVNLRKSKWLQTSLSYLGFIIGGGTVRIDPSRYDPWLKTLPPRTPRQFRQFFGMANYLAPFIPQLEDQLRPYRGELSRMSASGSAHVRVRSSFWSPSQIEHFEAAKRLIVSKKVLWCPRWDRSYVVTVDASDYACGGVLEMVVPLHDLPADLRKRLVTSGALANDNFHVPVAFFNHKFTAAEAAWTTTDHECFAIVSLLKKWRWLLCSVVFTVRTDHKVLTHFDTSTVPRVQRWRDFLLSTNPQFSTKNVAHLSGESNPTADGISRLPAIYPRLARWGFRASLRLFDSAAICASALCDRADFIVPFADSASRGAPAPPHVRRAVLLSRDGALYRSLMATTRSAAAAAAPATAAPSAAGVPTAIDASLLPALSGPSAPFSAVSTDALSSTSLPSSESAPPLTSASSASALLASASPASASPSPSPAVAVPPALSLPCDAQTASALPAPSPSVPSFSDAGVPPAALDLSVSPSSPAIVPAFSDAGVPAAQPLAPVTAARIDIDAVPASEQDTSLAEHLPPLSAIATDTAAPSSATDTFSGDSETALALPSISSSLASLAIDIGYAQRSEDARPELKRRLRNGSIELATRHNVDLYVMRRNGTIWVPSNATSLHIELCDLAHDQSGHRGAEIVYAHLSQAVYWHGMHAAAVRHVASCIACFRKQRAPNRRRVGAMGSVPADAPNDLLVVDFVGPLSDSHGFTYILMVTDKFSRYTMLYPTTAADAANVVSALRTHFFRFGLPLAIRSDNGSHFINAEVAAFLACKGVLQTHGIRLRPEGQGVVERYSGPLLETLRALCRGTHGAWSAHLEEAAFVLNTSVNRSIGTTPYAAYFGIEPHTTLSMLADAPSVSFLDFAERMAYALAIRDAALAHQDIAFDEAKAAHDASRRPADIAAGDTVMVWFAQAPTKLDSHWSKFGTVVEMLSDTVATVRDLAAPVGAPLITAHVDCLKRIDMSRASHADLAALATPEGYGFVTGITAHRESPGGVMSFLCSFRVHGSGETTSAWILGHHLGRSDILASYCKSVGIDAVAARRTAGDVSRARKLAERRSRKPSTRTSAAPATTAATTAAPPTAAPPAAALASAAPPLAVAPPPEPHRSRPHTRSVVVDAPNGRPRSRTRRRSPTPSRNGPPPRPQPDLTRLGRVTRFPGRFSE